MTDKKFRESGRSKDRDYYHEDAAERLPYAAAGRVGIRRDPNLYGNIVGDLDRYEKTMQSLSYNPRTRKAYNAKITSQARAMYRELAVMNGYDRARPVYIIGRTNNIGGYTPEMHEIFLKVLDEHQTPLIGVWSSTTMTNLIFRDVVYPLQMSRVDAVAEGRRWDQMEIMVLPPDREMYTIAT